MKIVQVQGWFPLSGAGHAARDLARTLARHHDVHFLMCGSTSDEYVDSGLKIHVFGLTDTGAGWKSYVNPSVLNRLGLELDRLRPDIVHFHFLGKRSFSLCSLLYSRRYPAVWTLHDLWSVCVKSYPEPPHCQNYRRGCIVCRTWPGISIVNKLLKEFIFRLSPMQIISPSAWLADQVRSSRLGQRAENLHVIPYGIDVRLFSRREDARAILKVDPNERIVLFMGGQYPDRKGLPELIEILSTQKDVSLWVLGGPSGRKRPPFVRFFGLVPREETPLYYSACDVLAVSTLADISSLAIMEAGGCERPAVAYRIGGVPEVVLQDQTGILVDPGDISALGHEIVRLLENPERRIRMGKAARAFVEERFSLDRHVREIEALYSRIGRIRGSDE